MNGYGDQVLTVGSDAGAMTGRVDTAGSAPAAGAGEEVLPDGVLARVGPGMAAAIGLVALVATAEAAWNLGAFVYNILELPLPLAIGFPVLAEAAAGSFALQDLRDRRQGHPSTAMRAATYVTLIASATINGVVGWASAKGAAGLLEVLPPLVLAAMIHLHGDRATRAHHSRAVTRPAWRAEQLRAAQVESVMDVLPLLAGGTWDGRATVDLLRRRLASQTLEPGEALIAAGWHDRADRAVTPERLRRLETVAATVWGQAGPPPQPPPPPSNTRPGTRPATRPTGDPSTRPEPVRTGAPDPSGRVNPSRPATRPTGDPSTRPTGDPSTRPTGRAKRTDEELFAELEEALADGSLRSTTAEAIAAHLHVARTKAAFLRDRLKVSSPPRLQVLPGQATGQATVQASEQASEQDMDDEGLAADA